MKKILFLCTQNSCRSQMAEAIVNHLFAGKVEAFSAGSDPSGVHPLAIKAMAELGVDISKARSKHVDEFNGQSFDSIITLCGNAAESCPMAMVKGQRLHLGFDDPAKSQGDEEQRFAAFRAIRDEMKEKLEALLLERLSIK